MNYAKVTDKEKAVIIFAIRTEQDKTSEDWKRMYILSRARPTRETTDNLYSSAVSTWKNKPLIKEFYKLELQRWNEEKERIKKQGVKEYLSLKTDTKENSENLKLYANGINFQDRNQFLNFLNSQANRITDDKQRLDYLKLISDLLRLKESDTKGNEEVQRFYTPLQCSVCPLYLKEKQIEED